MRSRAQSVMPARSKNEQTKATPIWIVWLLACAFFHPASANCQTQTAAEFWPEVSIHFQLPRNWRLLGFAGLKKGEDVAYQELKFGINMARQMKPIRKRHIENIDPDKEHLVLLAVQYERLQTFQFDEISNEHRLTLQATPSYRISRRLLISDRSGAEFRWKGGSYSTRYRNKVDTLLDLALQKFRFSPYASAETFYSSADDSWNQYQYSAGIEWPHRHRFMLETYYLRQRCTTCSLEFLNVGGAKLHLFF